MSLFIGTLAFPYPSYAVAIRVGVLVGSISSAVLGYAVMHWFAQTPSSGGAIKIGVVPT